MQSVAASLAPSAHSAMLRGTAVLPRRAAGAAPASRRVVRVRAAAPTSSPLSTPERLSVSELAAPVLRSHRAPASASEVAQTSAAAIGAAPPSNPNRPFAAGIAPQYLAAAVLVATGVVVKSLLDKPSRAYVEGPGEGPGFNGLHLDACVCACQPVANTLC